MTPLRRIPRHERFGPVEVAYSPALQNLIQNVQDNRYAQRVARRFMARHMPEIPAPNPFQSSDFEAAAAWFTSTARGDYNVRRRKLSDRVQSEVLARLIARRVPARVQLGEAA